MLTVVTCCCWGAHFSRSILEQSLSFCILQFIKNLTAYTISSTQKLDRNTLFGVSFTPNLAQLVFLNPLQVDAQERLLHFQRQIILKMNEDDFKFDSWIQLEWRIVWSQYVSGEMKSDLQGRFQCDIDKILFFFFLRFCFNSFTHHKLTMPLNQVDTRPGPYRGCNLEYEL